jgi:hypothetical protein
MIRAQGCRYFSVVEFTEENIQPERQPNTETYFLGGIGINIDTL